MALAVCVLGLCLGRWPFVHGGDIDPVLVGQWPDYYRSGDGDGVAIAGSYADVTVETARSPILQVIDVSDPANPRFVGACMTSVLA